MRRLCRGPCFGEPGITAEDRKEIAEEGEAAEADPEAPPTPEVSDPVLGALWVRKPLRRDQLL